MQIVFSKKLLLIFSVILLSFFVFSNSVSALTITQTENVSIGAIVGTIPILDPGGGGGGYQSGVRFSGFAYPGAIVTVQKGATYNTSVTADATGAFAVVVPENSWQFFSLYATDVFGRKSTLLNFPTVLYSGYLTDITGIRFAPTINTDKLSVKQGDYLTITGSATPNSQMEIVFGDGPETKSFTLSSDNDGVYKITAPMNLMKGDYGVKIHYIGDARFSKVVRVVVGDSTVLRIDTTTNIPGDCNFDQRITIVDFSVLAYWFGRLNPPRCVDTNNDGVINLVDFSILAFYWNG